MLLARPDLSQDSPGNLPPVSLLLTPVVRAFSAHAAQRRLPDRLRLAVKTVRFAARKTRRPSWGDRRGHVSAHAGARVAGAHYLPFAVDPRPPCPGR